MRKILLLLVMFASFLACSKDDDEKNDSVVLTDEILVGRWNVSDYAITGDYESLPAGYIYIRIDENKEYKVKFLTNTYYGKYIIEGNTMIGTTIDPITERFEFVSLDGDSAEIAYSNSDGDKYKFKAKKSKLSE